MVCHVHFKVNCCGAGAHGSAGDHREPLEDRLPRLVAFIAGERTVKPRGVHLVAVGLGPDWIGGHDGMLAASVS